MASWTTIPNSEIAEGEPIRASTGLALRDNPIAIGEGRPGATRIVPWAMVTSVAAGDAVRYADDYPKRLTVGAALGEWTQLASVTVFASGTVRVRHRSHRPDSGTFRTRVRRGRGTTVSSPGTENQHSSGSGDSVRTITDNIDVEPGDSIILTARFSSGDTGVGSSADQFRISTSGGRFWALGGGWLDFGSEPT